LVPVGAPDEPAPDSIASSRMSVMMRIDRLESRTYIQMLVCAMVIIACLSSPGCVRRKLNITSTPPGALVYLNDREVGRTPVDIDITYYGTYDVRLIKDGYEPLMTHGDASGPIWDAPGPDFIAEVLPFQLTSETDWHYDLEPEDNDSDALLTRARQMREEFEEDLTQEGHRPAEPITDIPHKEPSDDGLQVIDLAEPDDKAIEPDQDGPAQEATP